MELKEIEERVDAALSHFNKEQELYDYRPTHYNRKAWLELQEACLWLSEGKCTEAYFKPFIGSFRDRCEISYIDFHIKVAEPGPGEMQRMHVLFGMPTDERVLPPRDIGMRRAYLQVKTLDAMRLTIDNKQPVSEKLRQQFNYLMVRAAVKAPELLAVAVALESYNPYQKRLAPAPAVQLNSHLTMEETKTAEPGPQEPMFAKEVIDNSSFESRLAPTPTRTSTHIRTQITLANFNPVREALLYEPPPHELPAEIHEEFAAYCQKLYERQRNA